VSRHGDFDVSRHIDWDGNLLVHGADARHTVLKGRRYLDRDRKMTLDLLVNRHIAILRNRNLDVLRNLDLPLVELFTVLGNLDNRLTGDIDVDNFRDLHILVHHSDLRDMHLSVLDLFNGLVDYLLLVNDFRDVDILCNILDLRNFDNFLLQDLLGQLDDFLVHDVGAFLDDSLVAHLTIDVVVKYLANLRDCTWVEIHH